MHVISKRMSSFWIQITKPSYNNHKQYNEWWEIFKVVLCEALMGCLRTAAYACKPTLVFLRSPSRSHRSRKVRRPTSAMTNSPTHLTLKAQPREKPAILIHIHHSSSNILHKKFKTITPQHTTVFDALYVN